MDILQRYVAIDDKCAWPNLTLLPDGRIVATIFGEPCHQLWEGSSECWISRDGGRLWSFLLALQNSVFSSSIFSRLRSIYGLKTRIPNGPIIGEKTDPL